MRYDPGNGYVIVRQLVARESLNHIWMNLHLLVAKQLEIRNIKIYADMQRNLKALLDADEKVYVSTLSLSARMKSVMDLFGKMFANETALAYPSTPTLNVMANDLKIPDGYWKALPHQDWASTQGSLNTMVVWVPITNAPIGNFPLEVIPGSHRRGLLDGEEIGNVREVECDEKEFEALDVEFGDVVIMSGFMVHRTGDGGNGLRVAVSQRYENVVEPTFIARGYPCAHKRIVDREIKWKPTREEVRSVYDLD